MYFPQKFDFRESTFYLDENDEKVKLAKIEFLTKKHIFAINRHLKEVES